MLAGIAIKADSASAMPISSRLSGSLVIVRIVNAENIHAINTGKPLISFIAPS